MCVAAWAEMASAGPNKFQRVGGVSIQHVTELLRYDFKAKTVHIRLALAARTTSEHPVYLHCVHRRHVAIGNGTGGESGAGDLLGSVADSLGMVKAEGEVPEGHLVKVRVQDGTEFRAFAPRRSLVPFSVDEYCRRAPEQLAVIPFTSVCFGPLRCRSDPYLLELSLTIAGAAFDRLIAVIPNGVPRFVYSIEGPAIVGRDIEPLDLYGVCDEIRLPYARVLCDGINGLKVPIESYDVITCDGPSEMTNYVRLLEKVKECRSAEGLIVGGTRFLISAWHSDRSDFLIQRVSY